MSNVKAIYHCALMVVWKAADMAWKAWLHNDRMSMSLGTPLVIPYFFLPIGLALLALRYAFLFRVRKEKGEALPEEKKCWGEIGGGAADIIIQSFLWRKQSDLSPQ